jgi:hypothetical protein
VRLRFRNGSKGFLLPLTIFIGLILLALGFFGYRMARAKYHAAMFYANKEKAYHLAHRASAFSRAKINQARAFWNSSDPLTYPKYEKAPLSIKELVNYLNSIKDQTPGTLSPLNLTAYLPDFIGPEIESTLAVINPKAFPSTGNALSDSTEKTFSFKLKVKAEVSGATAQITSFQEVRLVNIQPAQFGKFGLFVREKLRIPFNSIEDRFTPGPLNPAPMLYYGGKRIPPQGFSTPLELIKFLQNQGWVYLGGISELILGLGPGAGKENQASMIGPGLSFSAPMLSMDLKKTFLNEDEDLHYVYTRSGLSRELAEPILGSLFSFTPEDEIQTSSWLRLHGSRAVPSPTLILGKIRRRYALLSGFSRISENLIRYLPYLDPPGFEQNNWPGDLAQDAIETIREHFKEINPANPFEEYQQRMSRLMVEDHNAAVLDWLKDQGETIAYVPDGSFPGLSILHSQGSPALPYQILDSRNYTLLDKSGNVLFERADPETWNRLRGTEPKVSYIFNSLQELIETRDGSDVMNLSGIQRVNGNCNFSSNLRIDDGGGGILLCTGDISINGSFELPDSEILTLVSENGDIHVAGNSDLRLGLIALRGTVHFPSAFQLRGIVACRDFRLNPAEGESRQTLWYDPSMDPTEPATRARYYRYSPALFWNVHVQ